VHRHAKLTRIYSPETNRINRPTKETTNIKALLGQPNTAIALKRTAATPNPTDNRWTADEQEQQYFTTTEQGQIHPCVNKQLTE
jgi:hypothetical protein